MPQRPAPSPAPACGAKPSAIPGHPLSSGRPPRRATGPDAIAPFSRAQSRLLCLQQPVPLALLLLRAVGVLEVLRLALLGELPAVRALLMIALQDRVRRPPPVPTRGYPPDLIASIALLMSIARGSRWCGPTTPPNTGVCRTLTVHRRPDDLPVLLREHSQAAVTLLQIRQIRRSSAAETAFAAMRASNVTNRPPRWTASASK